MVLWSTPESIERGEASWLAILETILAVVAYWGIAWAFDTHFHLMISVLVAPLLLLRSPESVALGVKWFESYWEARQGGISKFFIASSVIFYILLFSVIVKFVEPTIHNDNIIAFYAILIVAPATLMSIISLFIVSCLVAVDIKYVKFFSSTCYKYIYNISTILSMLLVLIFFIIGISMFVFGSPVINGSSGRVLAMIGFLLIGILLLNTGYVALGVWLRTLAIRFAATIRHLPSGMPRVADNWRHALLVVDSHHPAELVPGLASDGERLTITAIVRSLEIGNGRLERLSGWLARIVWFVVALFYRWSVKSTCWLYLPLVYLAWPHKGSDVDDRVWLRQLYRGRMEAVRRITGLLVVASAVWFTFPVADLVDLHVTLPYEPGIANLLAFDLAKVGEIPLWQWCGLISAAATFIVWLASEKLQFRLDIAGDWPERAAHWLRLLVRGRSIVTVISLVMSVGYMVFVFPEYYPGGIPELIRFDVRALPDWLWFIRDLYAPYLP